MPSLGSIDRIPSSLGSMSASRFSTTLIKSVIIYLIIRMKVRFQFPVLMVLKRYARRRSVLLTHVPPVEVAARFNELGLSPESLKPSVLF